MKRSVLLILPYAIFAVHIGGWSLFLRDLLNKIIKDKDELKILLIVIIIILINCSPLLVYELFRNVPAEYNNVVDNIWITLLYFIAGLPYCYLAFKLFQILKKKTEINQ